MQIWLMFVTLFHIFVLQILFCVQFVLNAKYPRVAGYETLTMAERWRRRLPWPRFVEHRVTLSVRRLILRQHSADTRTRRWCHLPPIIRVWSVRRGISVALRRRTTRLPTTPSRGGSRNAMGVVARVRNSSSDVAHCARSWLGGDFLKIRNRTMSVRQRFANDPESWMTRRPSHSEYPIWTRSASCTAVKIFTGANHRGRFGRGDSLYRPSAAAVRKVVGSTPIVD